MTPILCAAAGSIFCGIVGYVVMALTDRQRGRHLRYLKAKNAELDKRNIILDQENNDREAALLVMLMTHGRRLGTRCGFTALASEFAGLKEGDRFTFVPGVRDGKATITVWFIEGEAAKEEVANG